MDLLNAIHNDTSHYSDEDYNTGQYEDYNNSIHPYEEYPTNITVMEHYHPINVISMVLYSITVALGIPGNAIVIWIAGLKMKRTVNTVWFLNLAIADFLCCLSLPFSILHIALHYHWHFGLVLCKLVSSAMILNMFASIFLLTAISVDRCILVTNPIWSQNNRKTHLAWVACTAIWLLAFLMSLPGFLYREVLDETGQKKECKYDNDTEQFQKTRAFIRFVFGFLLPFLVIAVCYGSIALKVRSSRFTRSSKTFKVMLIVIVAFFVCWAPYHITEILSLFVNHYDHPGSSLADWLHIFDSLAIGLAYFNSCVNPVVYVFTGQEFKEKFRKSIKHVFESAFSEELTRTTAQSRSKTRSSVDDGIAHSVM